jgi:hypothetical protein
MYNVIEPFPASVHCAFAASGIRRAHTSNAAAMNAPERGRGREREPLKGCIKVILLIDGKDPVMTV